MFYLFHPLCCFRLAESQIYMAKWKKQIAFKELKSFSPIFQPHKAKLSVEGNLATSSSEDQKEEEEEAFVSSRRWTHQSKISKAYGLLKNNPEVKAIFTHIKSKQEEDDDDSGAQEVV